MERLTTRNVWVWVAAAEPWSRIGDACGIAWSSRSLTGTNRLFPPSFRAWVHVPSSGDVPPEARPYLEIAQQGARAVAYDPTSPGSVIVALRQPSAMIQEQADLIQQNQESVLEALAGSMRAAMESAGWEDVRVEPPELFDHRPTRGRAALLAIRFQDDGAHMGAHHEFRSVILYFEDEIFVVTAAGVDREASESVLEGSRW